MSDRPTSFHDFNWACGHTGPGYCKICRDEQVESLTAELAQWQTSSITPDGYKAEIERLTAELETATYGLQLRDAELERTTAELEEVKKQLDCEVNVRSRAFDENKRLREALQKIAQSGFTPTPERLIAKEALQE